ncbi:hypothetical protein PP301_gp062 [Gordonia phage GMA2]|uniref:Uncharacterized protein n=1 Tax=Gordonia phage GMA2 TaxID=1647283 RepID=A0A0K0N751_9CAUD|nr:hypothetical protein PP301_gp062 [Gordonia phage GMA2]AKJ72660.1 hypothetical protein GMA2_122 [Gordonia phage GMA2]
MPKPRTPESIKELIGDAMTLDIRGTVGAAWVSKDAKLRENYRDFLDRKFEYQRSVESLIEELGLDYLSARFDSNGYLVGFEGTSEMFLDKTDKNFKPIPSDWRLDPNRRLVVPRTKTVENRASDTCRQFYALRDAPSLAKALPELPTHFVAEFENRFGKPVRSKVFPVRYVLGVDCLLAICSVHPDDPNVLESEKLFNRLWSEVPTHIFPKQKAK